MTRISGVRWTQVVLVLAAVASAVAWAAPQLPVTSELCKQGHGWPLPDMKPGTLFCHGGDFDGASVVDVRAGGAGAPPGTRPPPGVAPDAGVPAGTFGAGPPAAVHDGKVDRRTVTLTVSPEEKTALEAQSRSMKAQASRNPAAGQSLPGPMCDRLIACCKQYGGSCCDGASYCR